ncbi:MAG: Glycosyl hydrolases family 43 [Puniceicoccaceae bacterium 5H]|nr:MAG: Glycosyl hydrolases family 43 [Puniceicoccaceae bacterium 5H]
MVFWASKTADDHFTKHRIWAAHTQDFREFSEPFVYIEKPTTVIDTTILRQNGKYYRFTKDEKYKAITMEVSDHLMHGWADIEGFNLGKLEGYEGPTCFMLKPDASNDSPRWCLLLDWYSQGRSYQSYITDDLSKGDFEPAASMDFPFHPVRHGTVIPITEEELDRLAP